MTPEYTQLIADLFLAVQAKGSGVRRQRESTPTHETDYLESYEGGLINALLLLKSRAQIARFDLNSLGMAGLDPKSKGWVESVFQATHPNVRPAITSTDREDGKVLVIALLEADTR